MFRLLIVALAGCTHLAALPAVRPALAMVATSEPTSITIVIAPQSYAGWRVSIQNDRAEPILVLWDESTFVRGDGLSMGRLIRGVSKFVTSDKPQPATPIAHNARAIEYCIPERLIAFTPRIVEMDSDDKPAAPTAVNAAADCAVQRTRCNDASYERSTCDRDEKSCLVATPDERRRGARGNRRHRSPGAGSANVQRT